MPPLQHSTADHLSCSPLRFGRRGKSIPGTHYLDKEPSVSDLNASTDSESDSDESSSENNMETYSSQPLSSPSLIRFHEETSIDRDLSHWFINSETTMAECSTDKDRMDYVITETDCYNDELYAQNRNTRYTRRVNFALELEHVIEIPSHRVLEPEEKEDLYTSMRVIHAEAIRNRKEWDFELRKVQNVREELDFMPDCNGNLWHPAHWSSVI